MWYEHVSLIYNDSGGGEAGRAVAAWGLEGWDGVVGGEEGEIESDVFFFFPDEREFFF